MKQHTGCLVKNGNLWYVRLQINGRIVVRPIKDASGCGVTDRSAAEVLKPRVVAGLLSAPIPTGTAWKDTWRAYLASPYRPDSGEATLKMYGYMTASLVKWARANTTLPNAEDLDRVTAERYCQWLAGRYSKNTYNKHIIYLRLLYKCLKLDVNTPFSLVRLKRTDATPHKAITLEQTQVILGHAKGEYRTLILLAMYTALRRKDLCLLKWERFDFAAGTLTVTPAKTARRSGKVVCLPIHPTLLAHLFQLRRDTPYVMPEMAMWYAKEPSHISKQVRNIFEAAGLQTQEVVEKTDKTRRNNKAVYSLHSFRFTMGTALLQNGYSYAVIADTLGHTSEAMARHYSSVLDSTRKAAILSLPDVHTA